MGNKKGDYHDQNNYRFFWSVYWICAPFFFATVADAEWTVLREDDIIRGDGIEGMLQDVYFMDDQNGLVLLEMGGSC